MTDTFWLDVSSEIQHVFILVSMVIFLTIPHQGKRDFIEVGVFIAISFVSDTIGDIMWFGFKSSFININNNIFTILVFPIVVLIYRRKAASVSANKAAYVVITLFLIYAIINFFLIQGPNKINSYTKTLGGVGTIIICIAYFYSLIKQLPTESITTLPMFWITSAFLISRSGSFFLNLSTDYLVNVVGDNLEVPMHMQFFLGVIFFSMLSYALLLVRAQYNRVNPIS